ncbi:adenylate kinase [Leptolyngbya sp. FACHB-261]|uniref:adenylate kinase n=1 Tax=Leptolyngbya sp. FACHB-261 TaxID=2692806 RepID=UPI0016821ACC|nr:adenylate kinase [Leptolyngbya sp. FACHB-261]MBD2105242.1 adenylate kinase [Leptolyngbya sp. FACHB-261]
MTRLIFLGAPGVGKGTQASRLAQKVGVPHISTGDLLRTAVSQQTPLGSKAKAYMDQGQLVPDELVVSLIEERIQEPGAQIGWILDGFPRNVAQANVLEQLLDRMRQHGKQVINLDVPVDVIVQRLLERGRADDTEEVIRNRLSVYQSQTTPLLEFYKTRDQLETINGNASVEEVEASLWQAIQAQPEP